MQCIISMSFDAYLSNGVVEANKCSETTNKLYNGITLLFMQVGASWERIINVHSAHYMHINFSVLMAPLQLFLYAILSLY